MFCASKHMLWLLLLCGLVLAWPKSADSQSCPANAHVDQVEQHGDVKKIICTCDFGYQKQGARCVRIETLRPATEREVRGLRAQCVADAGRRLRADLKVCEKSLFSCLINKGNSKALATCATTVLIGLADPTKVAGLAALAVCGLEAPDAAEAVQACRREADCKIEKVKVHDQRVSACKRD